ncbi:MAG: nucleotidyltransferase domain-containing protein [Dehalococcoidia bacterium]|nr:nucleotidyltransferase domain-containing protein [Dehalococcoidia bacterium]
MTTRTEPELQQLYEGAAREFAQRVLQRFPDVVHAVVLYGSVARGTATENSDVDVLVLRVNGTPSRDDMVDISESIDFENEFRTFVIATAMTPERLQRLIAGGFPIANAVLREGEVLHDDGTFEGIRKAAVGNG